MAPERILANRNKLATDLKMIVFRGVSGALSLLLLREKVPEGRMRGVELSPRIEAWEGAAPHTRFFR
ncbi:hypothetical protein ASD04_04625 [Devosia sp. Root436]|nr:hypothetical protein ASD04_04625 [Devosia sp. Root436]